MALSKQLRDELAGMEYEEVHMTPEGVERLKDKLAELKRLRPERAAEANGRRISATGRKMRSTSRKSRSAAKQRTDSPH